jgi:hypothetical protein
MRQVLSNQHVADVLPVDSEITACASEIACARAPGAGPARAIHNLQIDIGAESDHLSEPRPGPSGEHAFKAAMSVASQNRLGGFSDRARRSCHRRLRNYPLGLEGR